MAHNLFLSVISDISLQHFNPLYIYIILIYVYIYILNGMNEWNIGII